MSLLLLVPLFREYASRLHFVAPFFSALTFYRFFFSFAFRWSVCILLRLCGIFFWCTLLALKFWTPFIIHFLALLFALAFWLSLKKRLHFGILCSIVASTFLFWCRSFCARASFRACISVSKGLHSKAALFESASVACTLRVRFCCPYLLCSTFCACILELYVRACFRKSTFWAWCSALDLLLLYFQFCTFWAGSWRPIFHPASTLYFLRLAYGRSVCARFGIAAWRIKPTCPK